MSIPSYFTDFLSKIRLKDEQVEELKTGHTELREKLEADKNLSSLLISTFLQGSYRRSTAVKPQNGKRADVDIIVVTKLNKEQITPKEAIELFRPFCEEHYADCFELQGRSIGIKVGSLDMDIVITSAPTEVDQEILKSMSVRSNLSLEEAGTDWQLEKGWGGLVLGSTNFRLQEALRNSADWKLLPLLIPDREAQEWAETHPLEQIRWTWDKNSKTNGHFVNVVKAIKWWRILRLTDLKYPKGYPIEHMIGDCCPDGISSVAEGVTRTLETIVTNYQTDRFWEQTPTLPDRGVPSHNVWKRVSSDDFVTFYDKVKEAASTARNAYDAQTIEEKVAHWKLLFGNDFPDPPKNGGTNNGPTSSSPTPKGGFSERLAGTAIGGNRWA